MGGSNSGENKRKQATGRRERDAEGLGKKHIAKPAAAAAHVQGPRRDISVETWPGPEYFFPRAESAARAHRIGDAAAQQTQGVVGVHCAAVRGARDRDCGTEFLSGSISSTAGTGQA